MKTSTRSRRRRSFRSSRHRSRQSRDRYGKSIGEARLMVGNCDPHDVPRAEVPRWLPLRCGHRASVACLRTSRRTIPDYAIDMHTHEGQGDGPWPRSLPQRRREAGPAADRAEIPIEDEAYRLWAIKQRSK